MKRANKVRARRRNRPPNVVERAPQVEAKAPNETPRSGLTVHELTNNETVSTGVTRDGDEWLALGFAESKRFGTELLPRISVTYSTGSGDALVKGRVISK